MDLATLMPDLGRISQAKLGSICLSIDLETPNHHGAGIFSIGIVPFSIDTGEIFEECSFYCRIDFAEVLNHSKDIGSTMKWWMQQSDEARYEVIAQEMPKDVNGRTVSNPLPTLNYFEGMSYAYAYMQAVKAELNTNGTLLVMGNGSCFDIVKFEETCRLFPELVTNEDGSEFPYNFWDIVDLRTLALSVRIATGKNLKKEVTRRGTHHNAIDDALYQAEMAVKGIELLEGK